MAIKQSILEEKWYYRVAKVVFLALPWVAVIVVLTKKIISNPDILKTNISVILQENINAIVYVVIGLIAYFVIINLLWKTFLYVVFGGVERDQKNETTISQPASQVVSGGMSEEDKKQVGFYLSILVILGIIYYVYFIWKPTGMPGIKNNNNGDGSTCISTGCGSEWHCFGTYYEDGLQKRVNGCLPRKAGEIYSSWSGTCRQCP